MDQRQAEELLHESESVIPLVTGSLSYVKELAHQCLENDIPSAVGRPPGKGGG